MAFGRQRFINYITFYHLIIFWFLLLLLLQNRSCYMYRGVLEKRETILGYVYFVTGNDNRWREGNKKEEEDEIKKKAKREKREKTIVEDA